MGTHGFMTIFMKNKTNNAVLIILACIFYFGKINIMAMTSGIFVSESQLYVITISDSTVTLESPYWAGIQPIPNAINCKYMNLECGFIQISSINDYYSEAIENMEILSNVTDPSKDKSIKFEFSNCKTIPLLVDIYFDGKIESMVCEEGIGNISLPPDVSDFKFCIRPLIFNQYGYETCYNGITEFKYEDSIHIYDSMIISLPGITNYYFSQWRIMDEIIEIIDDAKIRWRNIILFKQNKKPDGNLCL